MTPLALDSIMVKEQTEMLNDFLFESYEPSSSSDATSLVDELYRQIMCDAFSKLSGKVLARRLCTVERTSAYGTANAALRDFQTVLYTQDDRVFWYHASASIRTITDFIFYQARSNFRIYKKDFTFSYNEPAHRTRSQNISAILRYSSCYCVISAMTRSCPGVR